MAEIRVFSLRPAAHAPHPLHAPDRPWPETNCYLDLWIELLHALGRDPVPMLGAAAALAWEGDHISFIKPAAGDIFALTGGAVLQELALWDGLEAQVAAQLARGAVPLLEVDAYYLPDTMGAAYREQHTKTTIAVTGIDQAARRLEYLHNAGLFELADEDYAGILGLSAPAPLLFPYAELVRPPAAPPPEPARLRSEARRVLARCAATRGPHHPVAGLAAALPELVARTDGDPRRIHALCFNTARQIGGVSGLLADHLEWLGADGTAASRLAEAAKTLQFQLSRAARRRRVDDPAVAATLAEMAALWTGVETAIEMAAVLTD